MKVEVKYSFFDRLAEIPRLPGEVFFCSKDRAEEILSAGNFIEIISDEEEPKKEEPKKKKSK